MITIDMQQLCYLFTNQVDCLFYLRVAALSNNQSQCVAAGISCLAAYSAYKQVE